VRLRQAGERPELCQIAEGRRSAGDPGWIDPGASIAALRRFA
jgi:hypothetical protein